MLTDGVENTNGINKEEDLLFANKLRTVPEELKGYRKGTCGTWELQFIDQHNLKDNKTK